MNCTYKTVSLPFSIFIFFFVFRLFRAAPTAYGSSQARCRIGAEAAGLATATATWHPSRLCDVHHSSRQRWIPNLLSEARDGTCVLMNVRFVSAEPQQELSIFHLHSPPLDQQQNNIIVEVEEPQKCCCVMGLPLGFQIVFYVGGLGNVLKPHNMKSAYSSLKHKVTPNKYHCS